MKNKVRVFNKVYSGDYIWINSLGLVFSLYDCNFKKRPVCIVTTTFEKDKYLNFDFDMNTEDILVKNIDGDSYKDFFDFIERHFVQK